MLRIELSDEFNIYVLHPVVNNLCLVTKRNIMQSVQTTVTSVSRERKRVIVVVRSNFLSAVAEPCQ